MQFLMLLAILPTIVLIVFIYKQDKIEKEPPKLLAILFGLGAATVISALILENLGELAIGGLYEGSVIYNLIDNFIVIALSEELGKFVVLRLVTWKNKAFNYTFDAIVYAVIVSLGFATVENIMYVVGSGDISVAIMRAILSVPGHAIDAVFMGYFYGIAKLCSFRGNESGRKMNMALSLIVPVLTHGFYDFCLSMESGVFMILFYIFEIAITVYAFIKVRKLSKTDTRVIEEPAEAQPAYPGAAYGAQNPAGYPGAASPYGAQNPTGATGAPYGAPTRTAAPYGAQNPTGASGAPYGAPTRTAAPYGAQNPTGTTGAPYGAPTRTAAPYGAQTPTAPYGAQNRPAAPYGAQGQTGYPGAAYGAQRPTAAPGAAYGAQRPTAAPGAAYGAQRPTAAPGAAYGAQNPAGAPSRPAAPISINGSQDQSAAPAAQNPASGSSSGDDYLAGLSDFLKSQGTDQ